MTVRLLAEAEAELDEAVAHYEALSAGLGAEFAADIRAGLALIEEYPDGWQLLGRRVRRYRLRRFPFGLVYAPLHPEIVVVAVMHLHRRPGYWKERLAEL